jgi:transposase
MQRAETAHSSEKLVLLKKAFAVDGMSPGQAAEALGITYATAKRWYDKWSGEIKKSLESRLLPSLQKSVRQHAKRRQPKTQPRARSRR